MSEPGKHVMAFLESAGAGSISGNVSEWPQLKPACAWAAAEIRNLRASLAAMTEAKKKAESRVRQLEEGLQNIAAGPRTDPTRCSSCNGTGMGSGPIPCICKGRGTVEAERDGYKVAALERIRRTGGGHE